MNSVRETAIPVSERAAAYVALAKPDVTFLVVITTVAGFYIASRGPLDWALLAHTLIGTMLAAAGTATLNQYTEREADALMRRTAARPIPSGLISPTEAFWLGSSLVVFGVVYLSILSNVLAAALTLATTVLYLGVYTPLKKITPLATFIGAFPGAIPPLIGWAAARGSLSLGAWILFAVLFLWQFPHFLAIAWMYREDYARAGILMLPVVEPDGMSTGRQIILYASTLIPVSLFPVLLGMSGKVYLVGALILGGWFLYTGVRVAFDLINVRARRVLLASIIYLPMIYVLMVFDRPPL